MNYTITEQAGTASSVIARQIDVLDHGYVRFIDRMGTDQTIIEAARMSTGKGFLGWEPGRRCVQCGAESELMEKLIKTDGPELHWCHGRPGSLDGKPHRFEQTKGDANLLEFLYCNEHHTPLEMCELAIEAYWPIMVGREAMRHRVFSFNEFSARYAQMPNEHYVPTLDRFKPVYSANKQQSSEVQNAQPNAEYGQKEVAAEQQRVYQTYEDLIRGGAPREIARVNTPVSRYTRVRMKGDLRGWLGFLKLRLAPSAQWEIRQYAQAVAELVKVLWPRTWALFEEYTLSAVAFSRLEVSALKELLSGNKLDDEVTAGIWKKVFK